MGNLFTKDDNVVELATFVAMGSHLHTREPIRTLADLKGKVFGAQDSAGVKVLEELGASASVMVGSDAYLGLQRGTIDGVLSAWGWVNNFKLNEVTTYHTLLNLNPGTYSSVMNKDTYDKLTAEERSPPRRHQARCISSTTRPTARRPATGDIPAENIFTLSADDQAGPCLQDAARNGPNGWPKATAKGWPGQEILDETARLMTLYDRN
jgi:hypothetical protein